MKKLSLVLLTSLIMILKCQHIGLRDDGLCQGNHFLFLSTYLLGRQQDLTLTFQDINKLAEIGQVSYSDELFRTYRIYNISQNITYLQAKQNAALMGQNVLRITNGTIRINLAFNWSKTQLGSSLEGSGTAIGRSDIITYQKTLNTNVSHELQWHLSNWSAVTINNGLSLNNFQPYNKDEDYKMVSTMLNTIKTGDPSIKDQLIKAINLNYSSILKQKILEDQTYKFDKTITYLYKDYHGPFQITYNQTLMNSTLAKDGLYLLFSQVTIGDPQFQCGPVVPQVPDDPSFGGLQEFLSNSLLKSTLRYALKTGFLNVRITQQFWQSQAFQFFMGDVHDVMPSSTKMLPTLIPLTGRCDALNDPVFSFTTKSSSTYTVKVNFACHLNFNSSLGNETDTVDLVGVNIVVQYQIKPQLQTKALNFRLTTLKGTPSFVQIGNFKIEYTQLAEFIVEQTIALAKGGLAIGSSYKALARKSPGVLVKNEYLCLYDSSAKSPKQLYT